MYSCCGLCLSHGCWPLQPHALPPRPTSVPLETSLLGVSSSPPNVMPSSRPTDPERPRTTSQQRSPPASPKHPRTLQQSQLSSPTSETLRNGDHNLPCSSQSTSLNFGTPQRIDSNSPKFGGAIKVVLVTRYQHRRRTTLSLPRGQTPDKTYKYIESFAKNLGEDVASDQELVLEEGSCKIICKKPKARVDVQCHLTSPEIRPLSNPQDWNEIETVVHNYESSHADHGNIIVVINRKLKLMARWPSNADAPSPRKAHWNHVYYDIDQNMKKVGEQSEGSRYMPNDIMQRLMKEEINRDLVKEEFNNLNVESEEVDRITDRILREAPKLLLIFVHGRADLRFLKILLDHGVTDEALPLPNEDPIWLPKGQDVRDKSDINEYNTVRRSQWPFQAVVFDKGFDQHRKLDPQAIVPFRSKEVRGTGSFSVVYKVRLEASHQKLYKLKNDENPELALKEINRHRNSEAASANERLLLKGLKHLGHDHIIELLASYEQNGYHYFIFPLADFSLEELMRQDPEGFDDPKSLKCKQYVAWILDQFAGIADGLVRVHVRSTNSDSSGSLKAPTAELLDPSVAQDKRPLGSTGYHHDIKPQNLLYFRDISGTANPCPEHGILQIADFGIGKFHSLQSGSGTKTVRGTPTYAAPESKIPSSNPNGKDAKLELKLSRPYDVWSLGCVLMEVLVWLVYGTKGWKEFNDARLGPVAENDPFQTDDGYFFLTNSPSREAKVRAPVEDWMNRLEKDPRLTEPESSLAGLLQLIKVGVLVVDPNQRIGTQSLAEELGKLAGIAHREANDGVLTPYDLSSHDDGIESSGTPAVTLDEYDIPESPTTASSDSAPRRLSVTQELITARPASPRPASPVTQGPQSGSPRSSLALRRAVGQQCMNSHNPPPPVSSTNPRPHNHPPSRSSTVMTTTSVLSTIVEPATTRQEPIDESDP